MGNGKPSVGLLATIKESEEKKFSYITMIFTLLVIALLIVFAIRPTVTTIVKINNDIKVKEGITEQLEQRIQTITALDKQYESSKEKFDLLKFIYPTAGKHVLFIANIESVVARNGYKLNSIGFDSYEMESYNIQPTVLKPGLVSLSVSGEYSNLINLLKDLESLPMYPVIENVSFAGKTGSETTDSHYSIALRIYHVEEVNFYSFKEE